MDRELAVLLKLSGLTYQTIADKMGVSRQRVQQVIGPPSHVRKLVIQRADGRCQDCGLVLDGHGNIHHDGGSDCDYNSVESLVYLCIPCHIRRHFPDSCRIPSGLPPGRPKGSKSKRHDGYTRRTRELRERYGDDVFRKWGKKGGNPVLVRGGK